MKWITRSHVHVDRVACPWLIARFVDNEAEFLFVPKNQVDKSLPKPGRSRSMHRGWNSATTRGDVPSSPLCSSMTLKTPGL